MIPVILSGGSGTRLWPLSRQAFPKQFCEFIDESLYARTARRLMPLGSLWTITTQDLKVLTNKSLKTLELPVGQAIYEPCARNTAPAIALMCHVFKMRGWGEEVVGIFPADHLIGNDDEFVRVVREGARIAALGEVVTLGIAPTFPATGYGYIETSGNYTSEASKDGSSSALRAVGFREKPSAEVAAGFISRGGFYWNAGMFIFKVNRMAELFQEHAPLIWNAFAGLKEDLSNLDAIYPTVQSLSIDYAIMERLTSHVCLPCHFEWNDLGSWDAIAEVYDKQVPQALNTVSVNATGNFVMPFGGKTYALVDVDDLIVVDTADALMVTRKGSSEKVKDVVAQLKLGNGNRATQHVFEVRPWGSFETIRDSDLFKSKTIRVDQGEQLSYQSHNKRAEHWIIARGSGEVVLEDKVIPVSPGSHVYIPLMAKHRIRNTGIETLEFVEIQLGSYFGEDDIVRYEDSYGRK
jgi:mannose-1-phosphate guanylyltransferase/mannose-6-phosphate isomerase